MNEVKNCSISGVAFTLDKDAYEELHRYLESLRNAYKDTPEGNEIVADIEARIAELILSVQNGSQVVAKPLILNIIQQLGSARDISEQEDPDADLQPDSARIPRRLYRDLENAKLGGVCAGIGKYFDIDPIWLRLGFFVPLLMQIPFTWLWLERLGSHIFGVFVLTYLIMWFVVPVARSARQKLEMNGNPITPQSVASTTAAANDVDTKAKSVVAETVSVFGKIVLIVLKLIAGALVFALILGACALVIGLICVVIGGYEFLHLDPSEYSIWLPITGILIVLIFVLLLIYVFMCLIASRKPNGKIILATFLLWIVTIVSCIMLAVRAKHAIEASEIVRYKSMVQHDLPRPDMKALEQQLEELEGISIEIRDSTSNTTIKVQKNRVAPAAAGEANADHK